ncbi:MAG: stage V sporulation protein AA [Lachnospiraceae bacterium]|nr:stage V sporulation protein AA [Lachnospiraceae bacterium]MBD5455618.1 stage V sporulation protein AA [Lachnospiraceae bacterium]
MAANAVLYLKAQQNAEVMEEHVCVKDIASVYCSDSSICAKVRSLKVYCFCEEKRKRQVISILKVIELIEKECPGVMVENIGETAILIELVNVNAHKGPIQLLKLIFVACISFFGTGFTIMAFHNDISINKIFESVYELVMGYPSDGYSILEVSYSIGMAVGIIVFFNHVGGRRLTKDPTPIEVEMKIYETDVNKALIETADREDKTIDVS